MTTKQLSLNIGDRVESVTDFMYGYDQLVIDEIGATALLHDSNFDYCVRDVLNDAYYCFNEGALVRVDSEVQS